MLGLNCSLYGNIVILSFELFCNPTPTYYWFYCQYLLHSDSNYSSRFEPLVWEQTHPDDTPLAFKSQFITPLWPGTTWLAVRLKKEKEKKKHLCGKLMYSKLKNNICCSAQYVQRLHFRVKLIAKLLNKVRNLTFFYQYVCVAVELFPKFILYESLCFCVRGCGDVSVQRNSLQLSDVILRDST